MSSVPASSSPTPAPVGHGQRPLEKHTARLSVLIDPKKKTVLEAICRREDLTPSQVVRQQLRGGVAALRCNLRMLLAPWPWRMSTR